MYPNRTDLFILDTDASKTAIGAELLQVQNGVERVVSYGSCVLRYCVTRRELLTIVCFTRQYRHFLLGRKFMIRTDHNSLAWLMRFQGIQGQLARWIEELSQFNMRILHRQGRKHSNADALSRIPDLLEPCDCYRAGTDLKNLKCGSCPYCTRAHHQWSRFDEEVDDVVPLSFRTPTVAIQMLQLDHWLPAGYTVDQIVTAQRDDANLELLLEFLESGEEPTEYFLMLTSAETKAYWLNKEQFILRDGVLLYRYVSDDPFEPETYKLVVPETLRQDILELAHDVPTSGHLGITKTLAKLKRNFFWYKMRSDIETFVKSCRKCSINKKPHRKAKAKLGTFHAGMPMERVHLDILGPYPQSHSGNVYILMLVDQFTKWLECYPLPDQNAETIAKAMVEGFIARFGCPLQIHTDQGRNFTGNMFTQVCQLLQIVKTRKTPYHPASNVQVERFNKTLLQIIRAYLKGNQRTWDENLQLLAGAIRASVNRTTGFTANRMMLGREVLEPIDLMLGTVDQHLRQETPAEYVRKLEERLKRVHKQARDTLLSAQRRQKKDYDLKVLKRKYNVGDLVYLIDSSSKVGQSNKLKPIWNGPYLVIKVISPVLFRIKGRKREVVVHHDRLKPKCLDRSIPMWMRRLRHRVLDLDKTLPYEEDDDELGLTTLFEPPQPQQDNVQAQNSSQVSANQETSVTNLSQNAETVLTDLFESNSEPLFSNQETVEVPTQSESQPVRTARIRKKPAHLKDYLI